MPPNLGLLARGAVVGIAGIDPATSALSVRSSHLGRQVMAALAALAGLTTGAGPPGVQAELRRPGSVRVWP